MTDPTFDSPPPAPDRPRPASYWDYIKVDRLLDLQQGVAATEAELSDDEVRFIVIHQVDELWFKLVLRELVTARNLFAQEDVPDDEVAGAVARLRRVTICFELAAQHFRLMETMSTQDYLRFRDKLNPASGFQSAQMREIEVLLGLADDARIPLGNEGSYLDALREADGSRSSALEQVERRKLDTPTLKQAVDTWLHRTPIDGSFPGDADDEAVVDRFVEQYLAGHRALYDRAIAQAVAMQALAPADEDRLRARYRGQLEGAQRHLEAADVPGERRAFVRRLRAAILFVDSNRRLPLLSWPGQVIDTLIECEQAMLTFRQRHARMVERVIGRRVGTGGSDGVAYLDQTALSYRVFTEIWAARTLLLPPELCPTVADADWYGLQND
ncbi:MAG: tryptophan 2,3-dioxygenase family protein [bacterium]|nr:tryptophan 2,3-dioxygenase family protein [bacterium]